MLDEVGLVHMNGRIYDPSIGRFISPDPNVPDAADLQSFNRYAYVRNRPLSVADPSGFIDSDPYTGFSAGMAGADVPSVGYGSGGGGLSVCIPCRGAQSVDTVNPWNTVGNYNGRSLLADGQAAKEAEPSLGGRAASLGLDLTPVVGAGKSFLQLLTGKDAVTGEETSRLMEAGGLFLGLVPGGKALLKGEKALELGADLAKAARGLAGVPGRVGTRINLSNEGMEHVIARHLSGKTNASQFSLSEAELRSVLSSRAAVSSPVVRSVDSADGIRYVREFDAGRVIGLILPHAGHATARLAAT